jgi:hypothetical protein
MQEMTISQIRAINTAVPTNELFYVIDLGKEGVWICTGYDPSAVDDWGMVLKTFSGYKIKRITDGFINLSWFNTNADGENDDWLPISQALSYRQKLIIPQKRYKLDSGLDVGDLLNIESTGGEFIFANTVDFGIKVSGSATGNYAITQPLARGGNYITSPTLVAALTQPNVITKGAIVTIRNGDAFNPNYTNVKKGETKEVLRIDGDDVFFTSPAHDDYSTNLFFAQIVTPCYVKIAGDFTLSFDQDNYDTSDVIGMQVYLANKPQITARFNYCTEAALRINSCFQADVRVWVANSTEDNNGYGVAVMNGTTESRISGVFADCRHAVSCVADNSGVGGIPHHIKFHDIIASGARGNAMIDAHGTAGLIEFVDIFCTGGKIKDVVDAEVTPGGINIGCREAIIRGLTGDQLSSAVVIRSDANIECLDISDVSLLNSARLINCVNEAAVIKKIFINGVRGSLNDVALAMGRSTGKTDVLSICNVNFTSCRGLLSISNDFTPPDEIILTNVKVRNTKLDGVYMWNVSNHLGVVISGSVVKVLRLENCLFEGFYSAVKFNSSSNVEQFISIGNVYRDNYMHIRFDGTTTESAIVRCKEFKSVGDCIGGRKHSGGTPVKGVVNIEKPLNVIEYAQVDAFDCDDELYFFGEFSTVKTICIGIGKGNSFIEMAQTLSGYEILSGTLTKPMVLRGNGSPEGVVTAGFSALYTRKDAGGIFYKTTGSGNTGWQAL